MTRVAGALAGQATLALNSLVLQVVAAHALGSEGLGHFALVLGYVVMATAVSTGLVGDSLTVLDRHHPAVRAGLMTAAAVCLAVAGTGAFIIGAYALGPRTAALFTLATVAFMAADLLRRTVMACLRFWSLVLADGLGLAATGVFLLAAQEATGLTLAHLVAALMVGQLTACAVAWRCLPARERTLSRPRAGRLSCVVRFGGWRALQQFVRPTTLNIARWVVLLAAGSAAVGELEAARVFVAPALLLVHGLGSYLFASYAADHREPVPVLLRRADHGAATMLVGCGVLAVAAALAAPSLGHLVTGDGFRLGAVAVLGWGVYAASCAAVLPYGSLVAVLGAPEKVFVVRALDSSAAVVAITVALLVAGLPFACVPWLLSAGSFLGGYLCRRLLLALPLRAAVPVGALSPGQP